MTAAIFYHPEAYTTTDPKLMGRNAAGESFLRGFLTHSKSSQFWIQTENPTHSNLFSETARHYGRSEDIRTITKQTLGDLSQIGSIYYPSPNIGHYAYQRSAYGNTAWSLCGITHTTSSAKAMDAIASIPIAPLNQWDALICTSTSVKNNVKHILSAQIEYLKDRLGITRLVLPQLPVIPLGIHTKDFNFSEKKKSIARSNLGIDKNTVVILFMGRLSFHAKAHPLAMYQSLERASKHTDKKIILIECGWHANDHIKNSYIEAASLVCPSIKVLHLDGRDEITRKMAWAAADIFCSLSDNIQETFGITPIEAMASGLPVVVSDWDGYKETVRDQIDGFRIPTLMPQGGLGKDLALRHALELDSYDLYCGYTSSLISIDIPSTTQAFITLFQSPEIRIQMGKSGRERAEKFFDWSVIIPQYEKLWEELGKIRKTHSIENKPLKHPWPARLDPFYAFENYPTKVLTKNTVLALVHNNLDDSINHILTLKKLSMVNFSDVIQPTDKEIKILLTALAEKPIPIEKIIEKFKINRKLFIFRSLNWLLKLGVLKII